MAKSPRKTGLPSVATAGKQKKAPVGKKPVQKTQKSVSQKLNPMSYAPKGGKNLKDYDFFQKRKRRLSLASTSSESSDGLAGNSNDASQHADSDSESSLTAMSEQDETAASRKGSVFFKPKKATKSSKSRARKLFGGKLLYQAYREEASSDSESDNGMYALAADTFEASSSSESEDDSDNESSSSSDDEVDFVQLQTERKNQGFKGLPGKEKRKSLKYRRRSTVAIPEDINFKFDFDDEVQSDHRERAEEEDIGEELLGGQQSVPMEFQFDLEVPKFKEEELVSDDDYDYDDNDLLATLHADNDLDDFLPQISRKSSMSSLNDEDAFLKEEEKYLVNEFETNGFDDEEGLETARVMSSFNEVGDESQSGKVLQYASSDSDNYSETEKYYEDADDYVDFIDFDRPVLQDDTEVLPIQESRKSKAPPPKQKKKRRPHDSEEEDDLYLWNYFFSSDAESAGESEAEQYDADEQLVLEEIFRQNLEQRKREMERESSMEPTESQNEYEAGESTDEDESLPAPQNGSVVGSKVAKEVLSSKTADYRPPVLGIWAAVDSKPFGIIDGLSTRTLNQAKPKGWRNFSFKSNSEDLAIELDELLNISELDNDDENDVRIWRDFNNNKKHVPLGAFRNKNHVSHLPVVAEPMAGYGVSKLNGNGRRRSNSQQLKEKVAKSQTPSLSKDLNLPSKLKLRRASIADAVSEGYRPTKLGLYSETVLADVEEVLGEDRDLMALIKGL